MNCIFYVILNKLIILLIIIYKPLPRLLPLPEKSHPKEQDDTAKDDSQDTEGERYRQSVIDCFITGVSNVAQLTLTGGLPVHQHTSTIFAYYIGTCNQMVRHTGRNRHAEALECNKKTHANYINTCCLKSRDWANQTETTRLWRVG